jgi:CBS domain containing-hemolysin-like protein
MGASGHLDAGEAAAAGQQQQQGSKGRKLRGRRQQHCVYKISTSAVLKTLITSTSLHAVMAAGGAHAMSPYFAAMSWPALVAMWTFAVLQSLVRIT